MRDVESGVEIGGGVGWTVGSLETIIFQGGHQPGWLTRDREHGADWFHSDRYTSDLVEDRHDRSVSE